MTLSRVLTLAAAATLASANLVSAQSPAAGLARAGYDSTTRAFIAFAKQGNAAKLATLYAADAIEVDPDGSVTKGRAAFEQLWRGVFGANTVKEWTIDTKVFNSDVHIAYAGGIDRFVAVDKKTGKETTQEAQFLVVVRQQADNRWVLQYLVETPMPPKTKAGQ
jgi:uncharacterized protein (TIGR02246 family)